MSWQASKQSRYHADPQILLLEESHGLRLTGGKAAGLAALMASGFPVPRGLCVTTALYHLSLRGGGIDNTAAWKRVWQSSDDHRSQELATIRNLLLAQPWTPGFQDELDRRLSGLGYEFSTRWAVRSSATNEDSAAASAAGLYRSSLGLTRHELLPAIRDCWMSLWEDRVCKYLLRYDNRPSDLAMAVVIQPMLDARAAGVAFSIHPVTGRASQVVINAVPGLAPLLAGGEVTPDQYEVEVEERPPQRPVRIRRRLLAQKRHKVIATPSGLQTVTIPSVEQEQSSLSDEQLFHLARTAKQIEAALGYPVDLEWVWDVKQLWILQARPITAVQPSHELTNEECEWTRANLKETMPELPSPLGLSFLDRFMKAYILARYRRLGCRIPATWAPIRVTHGRPYLNITLFYTLAMQLRGTPAFVTEQMGGESLRVLPAVRPLALIPLIRAGLVMMREWRRVTREASGNFALMKQMVDTYRPERLRRLSAGELTETLDSLGRWLDAHELTFAILSGVAQSLQALGTFLPGWLGQDWRELLNASLQGQGTVISAEQLVRLAELVEAAQSEPEVHRLFLTESAFGKDFRSALTGSNFLSRFQRYLADYGHRGIGESDVMSPRLGEQPEATLSLIQTHVRSGETTSAKEILAGQAARRTAALAEITRRFGWRFYRGLVFRWWYRRLSRFSALRESNRHHLMYYSTAVRHLLLRLGERMVERGTMTNREDVFFLTVEEAVELGRESGRDWRELVRDRREVRSRNETIQVPDTIRNGEDIDDQLGPSRDPSAKGILQGIAVSAGIASGPARIVRSAADWTRVQVGDIVIVPVIDPGVAPLLGVAAGLVAEMGGTLSHGAIIAREYGRPALVNVPYATSLLHEGEPVQIDSSTGTIRRLSS